MSLKRTLTILFALAFFGASLAGCIQPDDQSDGGDDPGTGSFEDSGDLVKGELSQVGSSTVLPIAKAWAELLAPEGITVSPAGGGSGRGASAICAGEVDIGDMSRTLKQSEIDTCNANGVDPVAWKVAFDGLTVVVNPNNDFVDHLTVEELKHIWRHDNPAQTWSDVREGWPNQEIVRFGPDEASGTYEYFNEEILGEDCGPDGDSVCEPTTDYTPSANDNVIVNGVSGEDYAIGHFGFSYYLENEGQLKAVPIQDEGASEPVAPSFATIADGSYTPLSRPIFMVTNGVPQPGTTLHSYLHWGFTEGQEVIRTVGYVELDDNTRQTQLDMLGGSSGGSGDELQIVKGELSQVGSSTVLPIAKAWAELLAPEGITVSPAGGGSGRGASAICAGEVDIGDMSRTLKQSEIENCQANGIDPVAWKVAFDGLTVVINQNNDFVDYLTVEELKHIWRHDNPAQTWSDVREGWPNQEIVRFGPDEASGTYEYFNEAILGEDCGPDGDSTCEPTTDYTPSANDNVIVNGVSGERYAIGHFGFSYYLENEDKLKAVPLAPAGGGEADAVAPSFATIADGSYTPLSRPIFMVTNGVPEAGSTLHSYFHWGFTEGQEVIRTVGYVELDDNTRQTQLDELLG